LGRFFIAGESDAYIVRLKEIVSRMTNERRLTCRGSIGVGSRKKELRNERMHCCAWAQDDLTVISR
jgi:hypothetical protein